MEEYDAIVHEAIDKGTKGLTGRRPAGEPRIEPDPNEYCCIESETAPLFQDVAERYGIPFGTRGINSLDMKSLALCVAVLYLEGKWF